MKTTIEIPEQLFRQAKAKAALDGLSLRELFVRGLQLAVQTPSPAKKHRADFPLIHASKSTPRLTDEQIYEALNTDEELT